MSPPIAVVMRKSSSNSVFPRVLTSALPSFFLRPLVLVSVAFVAGIFTRELSLPHLKETMLPGYSDGIPGLLTMGRIRGHLIYKQNGNGTLLTPVNETSSLSQKGSPRVQGAGDSKEGAPDRQRLAGRDGGNASERERGLLSEAVKGSIAPSSGAAAGAAPEEKGSEAVKEGLESGASNVNGEAKASPQADSFFETVDDVTEVHDDVSAAMARSKAAAGEVHGWGGGVEGKKKRKKKKYSRYEGSDYDDPTDDPLGISAIPDEDNLNEYNSKKGKKAGKWRSAEQYGEGEIEDEGEGGGGGEPTDSDEDGVGSSPNGKSDDAAKEGSDREGSGEDGGEAEDGVDEPENGGGSGRWKKGARRSRRWRMRHQSGAENRESRREAGERDSATGMDPPAVPSARRPWESPYITSQRINVANEPACERVIPTRFFGDRSRSTTPIESVDDLKQPGQRLLLFSARFGLGNSLRGYVSAFVYAMLSGRRIVRLHAGQHAKVYDLLCDGFQCGFDAIHWDRDLKDGAQVLWREFAKLRPFNLLPHKLKTRGVIRSLGFSYPLVVVKVGSFFDFWANKPKLKKCVYRAFNCRSIWCVHSRAIHALVEGGPTKNLEDTIAQVVERREYMGGMASISGANPAETVGGLANVEGNNSAVVPPVAVSPEKIGVDVMFDVALHVRTRTEAVEHSHTDQCEGDAACEQKFYESSKARVGRYLSPRLWGCIRSIIERRKSRLLGEGAKAGASKRGFTIFLATDNQQLRMAFVDRLATMGTVYYSTGQVVHTSKVSGGLPTLAEWYLLAKADLVIEAESYVSTFAYFSGLVGNSTLASLSIKPSTKHCSLKIAHDAWKK